VLRPRLAMKQLTASDLTLFAWHYREHSAGKQKAINLNADVLVDRLFPSLPAAAADHDGRLGIDLHIYGPRARGVFNLQRKIIKHGAYKNWRLDGETIPNPDEDPERFNLLQPGDIAVFEFHGEIAPQKVRVVLLASAAIEDHGLVRALRPQLLSNSMAETTSEDLRAAAREARAPLDHPIYILLDEALLEDAVRGNTAAAEEVSRRSQGRPLSRTDLARARDAAERVGRRGEEVIYSYLTAKRRAGYLQDVEWVSDRNAIAAWDFRVVTSDGVARRVEVKSTSYEFERDIHFSGNELRTMLEATPYDIYRVYELREGAAMLRIAESAGSVGTQLAEVWRRLPPGVSVDGVSIDPARLGFGDPIELTEATVPEDPDD